MRSPGSRQARAPVEEEVEIGRDEGLDRLVAAITTDCSGEDEGLLAFLVAMEDALRLPCATTVAGVPIEVVGVDCAGNPLRGLVARCRRGGEEHVLSLLDVVFPERSAAAETIAAYRRWAGCEPLAARPAVRSSPARAEWRYPRHAGRADADRAAASVGSALHLHPQLAWDPAEQYWGEPGDPVDPRFEAIIAAGTRPRFEMEQVVPGDEADDPSVWPDGPILEAIQLRDAGDAPGAVRKLEGLLAEDVRCLDAHAHLGAFSFDADPRTALRHYATGVAIGELSLPDGFGGVLSWGLIDNRPFLRCLHGYGLCLWRLERFERAAGIFESLLWLNPNDNQGVRFLLPDVQRRRPWSNGPE